MLPEVRIAMLEAQIAALKNQLASHTDLKSREMMVRRQETALRNLAIETENTMYYERLMNLINKSVILQDEWIRFKTFVKLFSESEDILLMEDFFNEKNV